MNERIKELSKQAWESISVQDALDDEAFDQFDQKFAELIVRECAGVVFKKVGPKLALDVLEHFGVEE